MSDDDLQSDIPQRDMDGSRPDDSFGKKLGRSILNVFTGGTRGRVYHDGGYNGGRNKLGTDGNLRRRLGGVLDITTDANGFRVREGRHLRRGERALENTTGIIDGVASRFDGRPGHNRREDPEFIRMQERRMRQNGEIAPGDPRSPRVVQPAATPGQVERGELPLRQGTTVDATLSRLDDAQNKLNNGPASRLNNEQVVAEFTGKMKRENPGAYELYTKGGFEQNRAGLNEFFNYSREVNQNPAMRALDETFARNPEIGKGVLDQWRKDVGADSISPDYRGGKDTILDRLGQYAQDPDKLDALKSSRDWNEFRANLGLRSEPAPQQGAAFRGGLSNGTVRTVDPNEAASDTVAVQTPTGTATIPKDNPSNTVFTPSKVAYQSGNNASDPGIASGTKIEVGELNKLANYGVVLQKPAKIGQGDDAINVFADNKGVIYGGYTVDANGAMDKFVSRADLESRFTKEKFAGLETGFQTMHGINKGTDIQLASSAPLTQSADASALSKGTDGLKVDPIKFGLGASAGPSA